MANIIDLNSGKPQYGIKKIEELKKKIEALTIEQRIENIEYFLIFNMQYSKALSYKKCYEYAMRKIKSGIIPANGHLKFTVEEFGWD